MFDRNNLIEYVDRLYTTTHTLDAIRVALSRAKKKYLNEVPDTSYTIIEWPRGMHRTEYLAALNKAAIDDLSFIHSYMRLSKNDGSAARELAYRKNAKDQSTGGRGHILSVDGLIDTAIRSITTANTDYSAKCLALALLTGRRISEIGCTGVFEYVDMRHVLFAGQLKTKSRDDSCSYIIPVLHDSDQIIKCHDTLPLFEGTVEKYNKIYSKKFSLVVKELYGKFINRPIKVKDLRAIYLRIAWEKLDQCQTGFALYASGILGHGHGDLLTAQSYDDFIIKSSVIPS